MRNKHVHNQKGLDLKFYKRKFQRIKENKKKPSIPSCFWVLLGVVIVIPFLIAKLVNEIKSGCELNLIIKYGIILFIMAVLSLLFGALAGATCANASCGLAKKSPQGHVLQYSEIFI